MALPELIDRTTDPCRLAPAWGISLELATKLVVMSGEKDLPFGLRIISGYRDCAAQFSVNPDLQCCRDGRPCSTHTTCPATGADLRPTVAVTNAVKAHVGRAAVFAGLRWGGGSPLDSDGFPTDWNHVDLGRIP
jgi:hypothetical protein